jgi:hypothetical protein
MATKTKQPDIQRIKITLHTNLPDTSNATFDLTRKNLLFPYLDNKSLLKFENYPLVCTNKKYIEDNIKSLLFHKRFEVFFNWNSFRKFIKDAPFSDKLLDNDKKREIIEHNVKIMIKYLFPVAYPAYRSVKYISDPNSNFSVVDSALSIFKTRTENLYLNVNSKDYTVDEVTVLDTLDTNPSYMGLRNQLNEYFNKLPDAINYIVNRLDKELENKTFQKDKKPYEDAEKFVKLYKDELKPFVEILEYFHQINEENTALKIKDENKKPFVKAVRLAMMIKTMYQKPQNTLLDNEFSLSSIDYNQRELLFRGPNGIVDSLKDYYYPERISLNPEIAKCFDMFAESPTTKIKTLYEESNEFKKVIDMEGLQDLMDKRAKAFVDNIKIGTRDTQPRFQVNLRVSLTEGIIVDPNWSGIKCDYNNNKIGAKFNQAFYELPNPEIVELKDSIEKYEKSVENKKAKAKGKDKDKDKEKTDKKMVIFRPEGMDAVKTETGAAETASANVTAAVAVPVQKKEKEITIDNDIIQKLEGFAINVTNKNKVPSSYSKQNLLDFVNKDDKIKEYFDLLHDLKPKNKLDSGKDGISNQQNYDLKKADIISYIESQIRFNDAISKKKQNISPDEIISANNNKQSLNILKDFIDELDKTYMITYNPGPRNKNLPGGSRTKKRSNRRLNKTKKRRQ